MDVRTLGDFIRRATTGRRRQRQPWRTTVMALLLVTGSSGGALLVSSVAATSASASTSISAASGATTDGPVACGANGSCVAMSFNSSYTAIAIDVLSGTTWTSLAIGLPAGAGTATQQSNHSPYIDQVACTSASSCVGVGTVVDSSGTTQALLVTGSGTSWSDKIAPLPAGAVANGTNEAALQGIACSSSTCEAVGNVQTTGGRDIPLVLSGSGTSWTATALSLPSDASTPASGGLKYVACTSSSCMAVGSYDAPSSANQGLIETGSGTSWTPSTAPVPANGTVPDTGLFDVACGTSACVAVGSYYDTSSVEQGLIVSGAGTTFSATETSLPADAAASSGTEAELDGVACVGSSCTAAGFYVNTSANRVPLLLTGSGSSWAKTAGPLPSDANATQPTLTTGAIACTAGGSCAVAGYYTNTSGYAVAMLLTGSGSSWSAVKAPTPSNAYAPPYNELLTVACQPAATCVASGDYQTGVSSGAGLLDTVSFPLVTPTVSLSLSSSSSPLSSSVALTSNVTGADGQPTGTVTFDNGSSAISGCTSLALSSTGTASCTAQASVLGAGTHSITASYSGDFGYAATTSAASSFTAVAPPPPPAPVPAISTVSIGLARGFVAPISLTCTAAACTGTITARARIATLHRTRHVVVVDHHRRIRIVVRRIVRVETIGTARYSIPAATTEKVLLRLLGVAHSALLASKTHTISAVLTVTVTGGSTTTKRLNVREYVAPKKAVHHKKK